jgi:ISXO2-like transposase domain/Homeodomain-like domain
MAGTHLVPVWRAYASTMRNRLSTRAAARDLGVSHKTVWRWRHKVMERLAPGQAPLMTGIVEADETYFRCNYKGSVPVGRYRRKRGTKNGSKRGLGKDKVPVLVVRSRNGETQSVVIPGTATTGALSAALRSVISSQGTTLCTDGSGALRMAARVLQVKHVALVTKRGERERGIYHVQTVNSYQGRLKEWMAPFRGVATKYLSRYLTWHIIHERVQRLTPEQARSVPVGNTAELMLDRCCPNCGAALNAA